MPRPTPREMPGLDELLTELAVADVENLPDPEDPEAVRHARELGSLLAFALHFTARQKRVEFPADVEWGEPGFTVVDAKVRVPVAWKHLDGLADLQGTLNDAGLLAAMDGKPVLLALDCLDAEGAEFQYHHALYGEPVLLAFRVQAPTSSEHRIAAARADGWTGTLKEHNLVPGRSLFVPDDKLGLFLTEPAAQHLFGVLLLLPDGNFSMCLNPFAKNADPDMQYWLSWGPGEAASEWKPVLHVGDGDADADAAGAGWPEDGASTPDFGYHGALDEVDEEE